jgi:hypothetical protein
MTEETTVEDAFAEGREAWLTRIDAIGEEAGYFQTVGDKHWAFFSDEAPTLLVTFERADDIRAGSDEQLPAGYAIAHEKGWSHLCLISEGDTWYRDQAVYRYFDRLVDDAFFEDFDRVVFYGAGIGGYAACAYSVAAPGATVLAVRPVATLAPAIAEWDKRHKAKRRLNFTHRYGYAPDMVDGAAQVFIVYDPEVQLDAMHAALFTKPFTTTLRCRNLGDAPETLLAQMGVLSKLIEAACEGRMSAALFYELYRERREYAVYLRQLLQRANSLNRPMLEALICRNVVDRLGGPRFRRRLSQLEEQFEALGIQMPAPIARAPEQPTNR